MKKLIVFSLIVLFSITGVVLAAPQQPLHGFIPFYWVQGTVFQGGNPVEGRQVILYNRDWGIDKRISTLTDDQGKFKLNAYELHYFHDVPMVLGGKAGGTYVLAVPQVANFGFAVEGPFDAEQGYYDAGDVTLVEGGGPQIVLSIITVSDDLGAGTVGVAYSETLQADGGSPDYTWSISAGALPDGLNLAADGEISGDPDAAGEFDFTVQVEDSEGARVTKDLSITINIAPPPLAELNITTVAGDLGAGTVGVAYSETLAAEEGREPYAWSISAGDLPDGLNLDADSGEISGDPDVAGEFDFTVQVEDADGDTDTEDLSITINPEEEEEDEVRPFIVFDEDNPTPRDGAINVAVNQDVVITFSEAMDTDTVTITLDPAPENVVVAWNDEEDDANDNTVATITHDGFADGNTVYTVTVVNAPADEAAKDVAGNVLAGDNDFTFTTVAAPPPAGTVGLTIARQGEDVRVSWQGANPDVYYLTGDGSGSYSNVVGDWTAIDLDAPPAGVTYNGGDTFITHTGQVADGETEAYYKALVADTVPGDEHADPDIDGTYLANAPTVAKFNVQIPANGLFLLAIAVQDGNASGIFPDQLGDGEELILYPRSGQGLDRVSINSDGLTGADFVIAPAVGFWAENPGDNPIMITFAGVVLTTQQINLDALDLTGNPLPISIPSARIGGNNDDSVYLQSGMGLDKVTRTGGKWRGDAGFDLGLNQGFWYEHAPGNRRWDIDLKAGQAQMEEF